MGCPRLFPATPATPTPCGSAGRAANAGTADSNAAGTLVGQYRLDEKLGEGGRGVVWKALHVKLQKHVALKILPAQLTRDPRLVARFEREMVAVGKMDHPHVVRVETRTT